MTVAGRSHPRPQRVPMSRRDRAAPRRLRRGRGQTVSIASANVEAPTGTTRKSCTSRARAAWAPPEMMLIIGIGSVRGPSPTAAYSGRPRVAARRLSGGDGDRRGSRWRRADRRPRCRPLPEEPDRRHFDLSRRSRARRRAVRPRRWPQLAARRTRRSARRRRAAPAPRASRSKRRMARSHGRARLPGHDVAAHRRAAS